jgi:hypothetical protein
VAEPSVKGRLFFLAARNLLHPGSLRKVAIVRLEHPMTIFDDSTAIARASNVVINRRVQLISEGGLVAYNEAYLMIAEKAELFARTSLSLAFGGSLGSVVKSYREAVEANAQRLDI